MENDFQVYINEIKRDSSGIKDVYVVNFFIDDKPDFGSIFIKVHAPREADIVPLARIGLEQFTETLNKYFKDPPKSAKV